MSNFYPKLAWDNIKKNSQVYVPYLIGSAFTMAMFYMMSMLSQADSITRAGAGYTIVPMLLDFGSVIIGIFAFVILVYINGFLMRRRQRELGLYHILGMNKQNIAQMMAWETAMVFGISFSVGLSLGILLSHLMYLILVALVGIETPMHMTISGTAIGLTFLLFLGGYGLTYLLNFWKIRGADPIHLLKESRVGEKEPKSRKFLAGAGVLMLAVAYWFSLSTGPDARHNTMLMVASFFGAVLLVIFGTYALFMAGITIILKALRRNKKFYYKPRHFMVVSGLLYRIKQHAAGLASICILSVMVLVTVATTVSMYVGIEDSLRSQSPYDIEISFRSFDDSSQVHDAFGVLISDLFEEFGMEPMPIHETFSISEFLVAEEGGFRAFEPEFDLFSDVDMRLTIFEAESIGVELEAGEAWVSNWEEPTIAIDGIEFEVREWIDEQIPQWLRGSIAPFHHLIFVSDLTVFDSELISTSWQFDTGLDSEGIRAFLQAFRLRASNGNIRSLSTGSRVLERQAAMTLYGGLLFLGIFLGALFLLVTGLIIYYKQISEGYEDRERFVVMQKVGMSQWEVKKTIDVQVRLMFYLPLGMATIHLGFAFPIFRLFMEMAFLTYTPLFVMSTVGTLLVFGGIYRILYFFTARTYYKIVRF